jgi:hypothetical protein
MECVCCSVAGVTSYLTGRVPQQGELILGLYDVNQQRLIDNGGSVFIGDRLFIEIKYRTSLISIFLEGEIFFSYFLR